MIKEYFKSWNKFEIILVLVTTILIILCGIIFNSSIITMVFSIASIITAMLQAKGKVESQFTSIIVCILYSIISYKNRYFGEVIFYLLIMLPMAIAGVISWMSHKSNKTNTVEVNEIKLKEWILLVLICIVAFIGLYNLLKYFNTSQLLVSTISMIVSLLAIYLITVGQMNEEENEEIAINIKEYFESIGEFMGFETVFLKNFTSGDIKTLDDITKVYDNYDQIIEDLKMKIN